MVGGFASNLAGYLIPFFFVLALVIFVHELGHYLVGRWCGVAVEAFAIGFGPKVVGWTDSHGTVWKLCAVPLGGYVKFKGDLNAASVPDSEAMAQMSAQERAESFPFKPVWQRAAIVAAGPIANFLLAIVIFTGVFMFNGRWIVEPIIGVVVPGSPAETAGFLAGDRILSINGERMEGFDSVRHAVSSSREPSLSIEVDRAGVLKTLIAEPRVTEQKTPFGMLRARTLGIGASSLVEHHRLVKYGVVDSFGLSIDQIRSVLTQTVDYIGGLFTGREKADQLSGPIRIAQVSGKVAEAGFVSLLSLAAILSISIGFINLLPVPLLDGGHLLFYSIEAVFRRPLSRRTQELGFKVGLALVLMLMVFVTINDIVQIRKG
ncbi:MAG TPA: RIP metalloprotease RseP [Beijerinckiaceae bacterium]|nr:RIP metalloprotease RseP [Beijerinckiaceae bacterium]